MMNGQRPYGANNNNYMPPPPMNAGITGAPMMPFNNGVNPNANWNNAGTNWNANQGGWNANQGTNYPLGGNGMAWKGAQGGNVELMDN